MVYGQKIPILKHPFFFTSLKGVMESQNIFRHEAVAYLKSKSKQPGKIVKIDEDKLLSNNVKIIDLRNQNTRDNHKDNSATAELINTFNNFANKFQEVLLVGHVPKSCLIVD
jgi:hypothetical protein